MLLLVERQEEERRRESIVKKNATVSIFFVSCVEIEIRFFQNCYFMTLHEK